MADSTDKITSTMITDVGMVRDHNEDNGYADPGGRFFIVADGMGGHAAGEVASSMVVEHIKATLESKEPLFAEYLEDPTDEARQNVVQVLEEAVREAHQQVFDRGDREADKKGMGTTVEAVLVAGEDCFVAHVGDSRTYLLREGDATQITTDHTVAEVLVIEGKLSPEEGRLSPLRTILVNAVGVSAEVGVELAHVRLEKGDQLLLCSDGLHDYFPAAKELAETLTEHGIDPGLQMLVDLAKDRGGHDNITGISLIVKDDPRSEAQKKERPPSAIPEAVGGGETQPLKSDATMPLSAVTPEGVGVREEPDDDDGTVQDSTEEVSATDRTKPMKSEPGDD